MRTLALALTLGGSFASVAPAAPPQGFSIHDPDTQGVLAISWPRRAPDYGPMVGGGTPIGALDPQPVCWDAQGAHVLPLLAGHESGVASDANSHGTIVGESDDVIITHLVIIDAHAAVWDGGVATDLETLVTGGDPMEMWAALAINEAGQILGVGKKPGTTSSRAFLFENGIVTDLGTLQGPNTGRTEAWDMNEQGQVAGWSDVSGGFRHAVTWQNGVLTDLHDPAILLGRTCRAVDVNERGQICGSGDFLAGFVDWETATLWDHGAIIDIGTLGGGSSWAYGLNDHGDVVGGSTDAQGNNAAFLWRDGVLQNLNDLIPAGSGWWLLDAHDITHDGRIFGTGSFQNALRAYVLEPDSRGFFRVYGHGAPGAGGFVPRLWGEGLAEAGGEIRLTVTNAVGGGRGQLLVGGGTNVRTIAPGTELQILPLLGPRVDFPLRGSGAGAGWQSVSYTLPATLPTGDSFLQVAVEDASLPHGFTLTPPLQVGVR